MGASHDPGDALTILAAADGTISIDVGARFVAVAEDDLERILDRLAADGGSVRLVGGTERADDGDEPPDRESDAGVMAASYVLALSHSRGLRVVREA